MINKQAILIIAHNNIWTLKNIISILDSEYFDIFIHIDKKSNIDFETELNGFCKKSRLYIYNEIDVRWADYTIVECELFLFKNVLSVGNYTHLHLISGVDMPLKNARTIYDFFSSNKNKEFVHFDSLSINKKDLNRVKYYYYFTKKGRNSKIYRLLELISISIQKIFFINRARNKNISFQKGAQWCSITSDFASYLVNQEANIYNLFHNTFAPDELFIQTILYNSKFIDNLYYDKYDDNYDSIMRLIDWNRGNPYVFTMEDYSMLISSNHMFARKFDENKDREIIKKIHDFNKS